MPQKPRIYRVFGASGGKPPRKPLASAHKRGYTQAWRSESKAFLKENPFCVYCERDGRMMVEATCVDHVIAHKGDEVLFWERSNWAASCNECNARKAVREEGALGKPVVGRKR